MSSDNDNHASLLQKLEEFGSVPPGHFNYPHLKLLERSLAKSLETAEVLLPVFDAVDDALVDDEEFERKAIECGDSILMIMALLQPYKFLDIPSDYLNVGCESNPYYVEKNTLSKLQLFLRSYEGNIG